MSAKLLGHTELVPIEPPPSEWEFPSPLDAADDLVGIGADLEPATILGAYRTGLFPMPVNTGTADGVIGWWSPHPRGVIPLPGLRVSRSLRRSLRSYDVRINTAFDEVLVGCADERRAHGWISPEIAAAYRQLHSLGWAHSVEAWSVDDGSLAGGLYGVAIGGLFAGESMFHRRTDASKVALVRLVEVLQAGGATLLDVQWRTPHLARLGAVEISRENYLGQLRRALEHPLPQVFAGRPAD